MPGDEDGLVTKHVKYYSRMSESDSNIELSQVNTQTVEHFGVVEISVCIRFFSLCKNIPMAE